MREAKNVKTYSVYLLQCADGTFYTGVTTDVERRVGEHNNSPKGAAYTKARRPLVLAYVEEWEGRSQAQIREAEIKVFTRSQKQELILRGGGIQKKQ